MEDGSTGPAHDSVARRRIVIGILENFAAARRSGNSLPSANFVADAGITEWDRSELQCVFDAIDRTIAASRIEPSLREGAPARPGVDDSPTTEGSQRKPGVDGSPRTAVFDTGIDGRARVTSLITPTGAGALENCSANGLLPGTMIGNYEIIELIGRGGMGDVYRARQRQMKVDRIVALKLIRASGMTGAKSRLWSSAVVRFEVEMMAAARLLHENFVPIYEVGEHEGFPYYTMLLVDGPGLSELLQFGPIPGIKAAAVLEPIARAVHVAHIRGIVHRDIKPSNILIDSLGKPYLSDFGLAKPLEQTLTLTQTGALLGSPPYMSPEQARDSSRVTAASDVYSLGATMYEMLTGRPPFHASDPIETMRQVIDELPVAPRHLNRAVALDLETICLVCLEKDPQRRFGSALELAEELKRFLSGRPIRVRPLSAWGHTLRWVRRRPAIAGLLLSVLLTIVVGFATTMLQLRHAERARAALAKTNQALQFRAYLDRLAMTSDALSAGKVSLAEQLLGECPEPLRDWEWRYLHRLCFEKSPVIRGQSGAIYGVAFRPAGNALVTGGRGGCVVIWDRESGRKLSDLEGVPANVIVRDVAWGSSRNAEDRIAAACADGALRVWTKREQGWGQALELNGHKGTVNDIAFAPDGERIASAGDDGRIVIWRLAVPGERQVLRADGPSVLGLSFSGDGQSLAAVGEDQVIRLWESHWYGPGRVIGTLRDIPLAVGFSPRGSLLAVAGAEGYVTVWDKSIPGEPRVLKGHFDAVNALAFSPDGRRLASAGADRMVKIWDTDSWREVLSIRDHDDQIEGLTFSSDGVELASVGTDGAIVIRDSRPWDRPAPPPPLVLTGHEGSVNCLAIRGDGHQIASAGADGTIRLWEAGTGVLAGVFVGQQTKVNALAFSPNGRFLGSAGRDGTVWIWDLTAPAHTSQSGRLVGSHRGRCIALVCSPDGRQLASAGADQTIRLWAIDGTQEPVVLAARDEVFALAFSPDGSLLASAGGDSDGAVTLWNLRAPGGPNPRRLLGHRQQVNGLAFNPDGRFLVSVSHDWTGRIWETGSGRVRSVLQGHLSRIWGVAVSPNGCDVATAAGDWAIRVWDASTGQDRATLLGHEGRVRAVVFDPQGRYLASAGDDGLVKLWDAARWRTKPDGKLGGLPRTP